MIAGRGRNSGNSSVQCSCSPKDNDGQNPETELSVIRQSHHHYAINSWLFITRLNTFLNIHLIITAKHSEKTSEQKHPKEVDNNSDKSHMYYYNTNKVTASVLSFVVCVCVYLHTVVAHWAVRAPWRAIEAAGWAPFHTHLDTFDVHCFIEGSTEIVLLILIFLS